MMTHLGLVQRKHLSSSESHLLENCGLEDTEDPSGVKLTLTEQVFLLGLKDREGYVSFWNDYISTGLRGCILIDLFLRGRIRLDSGGRARSVLTRKVVLTNDTPTDDPLLDEVLKLIKLSYEPHTVPEWIDYMSSENWFQIKYRLRNVRNRIAKALVEKGVLKTSIQNFYLFSITTHPLSENVTTKTKIVKSLQNAILKKWSYDTIRMDKKLLALIFLAHASGVLDNALESLGNEDYGIAKARIVNLFRLDFERQAYKSNEDALMWAVIYALAKNEYV